MAPDDIPPPSPLFEARGLGKSFPGRRHIFKYDKVLAAQEVSFSIQRGEAVALVGESGSGKTTLARLVLRLETPDVGEIRLDGENVLAREPRRASLRYRSRVQMVFQDPFGSLNLVHTVGHHLVRPLLRHHRVGKGEARDRAVELLHTVGLDPALEFIDRRPYELSGGQRQRVAIARALAVDPDLLVADEPTSMLDVSIRMGVLQLLAQLKRDRGLAILLITHDLASARYLADRVLVLFRGRVVEEGPSMKVVESPAHPYTRALIESIASPSWTEQEESERGGAEDIEPGGGCPFAPRCRDRLDICVSTDPPPRPVDGRSVRCHLYPGQSPTTRS